MAEEKSSEPPVDPTGPAAPALPPTAEKGPPPEDSEDWATRFKYLFADFENFRKRASKERDSLRRAVRADVVLALLPTYEAVQRAREAVARLPPTDPVRRGIDLLVHEFETFLDGERVTTVARTGEPFRADWHEAVAEAPPRGDAAEGTVLEVVQQGYRTDSTLLRPAKVVVARRPPLAAPDAPASASAGPTDTTDSG